MEDNRTPKIDVVWAAVYVSAVCAVALALVFGFGGGTRLDVAIGVDLVVGWALAVTTIALLLTVPGKGAALLVLGRALIWLAFLTLVIATGLGILSITGLG